MPESDLLSGSGRRLCPNWSRKAKAGGPLRVADDIIMSSTYTLGAAIERSCRQALPGWCMWSTAECAAGGMSLPRLLDAVVQQPV